MSNLHVSAAPSFLISLFFLTVLMYLALLSFFLPFMFNSPRYPTYCSHHPYTAHWHKQGDLWSVYGSHLSVSLFNFILFCVFLAIPPSISYIFTFSFLHSVVPSKLESVRFSILSFFSSIFRPVTPENTLMPTWDHPNHNVYYNA